MQKKIGKKLISVLLVLGVLLSLLISQYANAWDVTNWGTIYTDYTPEDPYPMFIKDGYYITSATNYIKEGNEYVKCATTQNDYTFNDNGYLLTKVTTVCDYDLNGNIVDEPFTYPTETYFYDESGRIEAIQSEDDTLIFQYRDDGSFTETYGDDDRDTYTYTYTPGTLSPIDGYFEFEFDSQGRISRVFGTKDGAIPGPRFNEIKYSYIEDDNGRVTQKIYEKYFGSKTVETGFTNISYSENGRTEIENFDDEVKTTVYNNSNQIVTYKHKVKLDDSSDLSFDSYENVYEYKYNEVGNPEEICLLQNIYNNDTFIPDGTTGFRIVFDYEYHPKHGAPPTPSPEPQPTPTPSTLNGLVQGPDGKWALYKNGKVNTFATGVFQNNFGWWRVENGYVNFNANGIYQNSNGWWKTTNGKVTFKETGVFQNELGWWRVKDSKVDFKAQGIYQNKHGWWKTTDGKVTFKENGVFQNENGWWKVKDSKVDFNFTGIASNKNGSWYIKTGKVDFNKNGKVKYNNKTYTIKNGKVV